MARASSKLAIVLVALALALLLAAPAFALPTNSTTVQVSPGVMQRDIFSSDQVAQYPLHVTHAGYIHADLMFNSYWESNYLSVFIWDEANNYVQNINQGWYLIGKGRAVVDYYVPNISAAGQVLLDPDATPSSGDESLTGDTYDIIVVVSNDWNSRFAVSGYYPQTDLAYGADVLDDNNYYMQTYRFPKKGTQRLVGVPYGFPFDFHPTSEGDVTFDLQWPANVKDKTVTYDVVNAKKPGIMEQYLYNGDWEVVGSDYLKASPTWNLHKWGVAPFWYGLKNSTTLAESSASTPPDVTYHYCTDLALFSGDAAQGGFAPLATGIQTMGYKATLTYPCNLVIASAPTVVPMGAKATLKGTFALDGAWVPSDTVVTLKFQPAGKKSWTAKGTAKVGADGAWTAKVKVMASGKWMASAAGNDATGRAIETSNKKPINAI